MRDTPAIKGAKASSWKDVWGKERCVGNWRQLTGSTESHATFKGATTTTANMVNGVEIEDCRFSSSITGCAIGPIPKILQFSQCFEFV